MEQVIQELFYKSNSWWEENYIFTGTRRDKYLKKLEAVFSSNDILFLTGLRRVGKTSILKNLIDIISYHNIKSEKVIKDFYSLLMERSGKQLSLNKIAKILDIGVDSVRGYLSYFEDTYFISTVEKYVKLNERIKNSKKRYLGDIGLKNIVTGFRNKGAVFENMIFLALKHRNLSYVYEYGIEIDFITEDKTLIEAKYNSVLNEKKEKLFERFNAKEKVVINSIDAFLNFRG